MGTISIIIPVQRERDEGVTQTYRHLHKKHMPTIASGTGSKKKVPMTTMTIPMTTTTTTMTTMTIPMTMMTTTTTTMTTIHMCRNLCQNCSHKKNRKVQPQCTYRWFCSRLRPCSPMPENFLHRRSYTYWQCSCHRHTASRTCTTLSRTSSPCIQHLSL